MNFPLAGSVDLDGKPFSVGDESLRRMQNVIPDKMGYPVRRGSMGPVSPLARSISPGGVTTAPIHATDAATNVLSRPIWLSTPPFPGGFYTYACANGGTRLDLAVGDGDDYGQGALAVNLLETTPFLLPTSIAILDKQLICYGPNSEQVVGITIRREGGVPIIEDALFEGSGNANLSPNLVASYKGRAVYGRFGEDAEGASTIIFSDIDEPLIVGTNALTDRNLIIGDTGDKLTAIREVLNNNGGTPAQSTLLLLKEFSAHMIVAEPNESDDVDDPRGALELNKLSSSAGCISHATLQYTPYGLIWAGPDDVWLLPFGAIPIPIGKKIRPLLKNQPSGTAFRCHAAYANGFYRLALYSAGQDAGLDMPLGEQWWLDLRNGPPSNWQDAKWVGPMVFAPALGHLTNPVARSTENVDSGTCFMAVDQRNGSGKLYGVQRGIWSVNSSTGYMPTLVEYDGLDQRDIATMYRSGLTPWQPLTTYTVGSEVVVWETPTAQYLVVEPIIFKVSAIGSGISGAVTPTWPSGGTVVDAGVTWNRIGKCAVPSSVRGSEILTKVATREYDFGSRMVEKILFGGEVGVLLSAAEQLMFTQLVDGGREVDEIGKVVDPTVSAGLGSGELDSSLALLAEGASTKAFWTDEDTRVNGKSVQYSLEEVPGIALPSDGLTFEVIAASVSYTVTLTSQYYETASTFAAALCAAMNADPALIGEFTDPWVVAYELGVFVISNPKDWAPGDATESSRNIWSLLGYTVFDLENTEQVAAEIVPDYLIGDICYIEVNGHFRPFRRRPL